MSVVVRLQNLPRSASSRDIRTFFVGLSIAAGGVYMFGGDVGEAFIVFTTDEDARLAMERNGGWIKDKKVKLVLSSKTEMIRVMELAMAMKIATMSDGDFKPTVERLIRKENLFAVKEYDLLTSRSPAAQFEHSKPEIRSSVGSPVPTRDDNCMIQRSVATADELIHKRKYLGSRDVPKSVEMHLASDLHPRVGSTPGLRGYPAHANVASGAPEKAPPIAAAMDAAHIGIVPVPSKNRRQPSHEYAFPDDGVGYPRGYANAPSDLTMQHDNQNTRMIVSRSQRTPVTSRQFIHDSDWLQPNQVSAYRPSTSKHGPMDSADHEVRHYEGRLSLQGSNRLEAPNRPTQPEMSRGYPFAMRQPIARQCRFQPEQELGGEIDRRREHPAYFAQGNGDERYKSSGAHPQETDFHAKGTGYAKRDLRWKIPRRPPMDDRYESEEARWRTPSVSLARNEGRHGYQECHVMKNQEVDDYSEEHSKVEMSPAARHPTLSQLDQRDRYFKKPDNQQDLCVEIQGLPYRCREKDVTEFFNGLKIVSLHVDKLPDGSAAGPAYAEFASPAELQKALDLNGNIMGHRYITVTKITKEAMNKASQKKNPALLDTPPIMKGPDKLPSRKAFVEFQERVHQERVKNGILCDSRTSIHPNACDQRPPRQNRMPICDPPGMQPWMPHDGMRPLRPDGRRGPPPIGPLNRMRGPPPGPMNGGRPMHPKPPSRFGHPEQPSNPGDFGGPGCVVSVRNLHFSAGVQDILGLFRDFGLSSDNVIRKFTKNGKPTGYAKVAFRTPREALRAVTDFNRVPMFGRTIHLKIL